MTDNLYRAPESDLGKAAEPAAPDLDSFEADSALEKIRVGSNLAFFAAGLNFLVVTVFVFLVSDGGQFLGGIDAWSYIDAALVLICAIGLRKRSRAAGVVLLVYWIFAKIFLVIQTGKPAGIVLGVIFTYYFARAAQATFIYRRLEREAAPAYRPRTGVIGKGVIAAGVVLGLFVALGIAQMVGAANGWVSSTEVITAEEMRAEDLQSLRDAGIIESFEEPELFYSDGFTVLQAGAILTDAAVTRYYVDEDGEMQIHGLSFDQIRSVDLVEKGSSFSDSVFQVNGTENWFQLALPNGDTRFVESLRSKIGE